MTVTQAVGGTATPARPPATSGTDGGPPESVLAANDRALAVKVVDRWKKGGDELAMRRRSYWRNLSFFLGEQWVYWSPTRNMLMHLPASWSPLGAGRAKIVVNKIKPNMMSLLSRLTRSPIEFDCPPSASSDDVVSGAMLAEDVLGACYHDQGWRQARYQALLGAFLGGLSGIAVEWDGQKGAPLGVNDTTGKVVGTGEVVLTPLNVTEFCLEPGVRNAREAGWWEMGLALAPQVVKEKYGLAWLPKADASNLTSPLQRSLLMQIGRPAGGDRTLVLTMYERPSGASKGRYVVVVNDIVIVDAAWPFPWDELNLEVAHQQELDNTWLGVTLLDDAVPVQVAYNHLKSIVQEHAKKVGNARMVAPYGAFDEDAVNDDPASILWYNPDLSGAKPEYLLPPDVGRQHQTELTALDAELSDIMHVHDTSRGEASFDRASGQALALLSEKDDSPLGLMAYEQSDIWARLATRVLKLYETKVTETREVTVRPGGGSTSTRISRWNGKMLRGQTRVYVPLDSTMPFSQAARQALANNLVQLGLLKDPALYVKMLQLPVRDLDKVADPDAARAQRENVRMWQGEAEMPTAFDDHAVHISEHNGFRKSDAYQYAPAKVRSIFDDHVQAHENMAHEEGAQQMARAQMNPMLAALPQGNEPPGSQVPPTVGEQQQLAQPGGAAMQQSLSSPMGDAGTPMPGAPAGP